MLQLPESLRLPVLHHSRRHQHLLLILLSQQDHHPLKRPPPSPRLHSNHLQVPNSLWRGKRIRKVPKPPATGKQKRRRSLHPSEEATLDDAISDEEKAPVPVAEPVTQIVAPPPPSCCQVLTEVKKKLLNRGTSGIPALSLLKRTTKRVSLTMRFKTTDLLNVDAPGGRDPNYDALESGDEAARDDVVIDIQFDCSGWVSNGSAADGSEPDPERDEMDIALAKEFLDGFGGADAVLAARCCLFKQVPERYAPRSFDDAYKRHKRRCQANPATKKKTRRDVLQELQAVPPIKPHELCRFVGLLIARTICPNREKLANHWITTDEGAIPRGAFSSVMARDRFMDICRNLHFNDNVDPRATTDRAWKIRKVVEVLQRTIREGYVPPADLFI
ncbi:hypothetical protein, variant [Phytophthora nicotianae]|uniref:PiggyBac transposable element-derived protein domain-containing protein n=1 Tax=Phytophthora nicotianae TaxID=4792 RepID=W2N6N3_PHYNI|nr:hypothetical protein, variant [Phytophthora nicotianae]